MSGMCDGCAHLAQEAAVSRYDVYRAVCCDADKPMLGGRRVVAVSSLGPPRNIMRPAWCRRKKE